MAKTYHIERKYRKLFQRYIKKYFAGEQKELLEKTNQIYNQFKKETPDIGGRKNMMANNLDMMMAFCAFYEASDKRIDGKSIEEMANWSCEKYTNMGKIINFNKPWVAKLMYKIYISYAKKVEKHKSKGEWKNSWGVLINPEKHNEGCAFHLVGCPLVDFAKSHGYMDLMPYICSTDHISASAMYAKLIRTHTVAEGAESCDFWYVGDQSKSANLQKSK